MKNVIVIDFSISTEKDIIRICEEYDLNHVTLLEDKASFNLGRVYINIDSKLVIAYTFVDNPSEFIYTDFFEAQLKAIPTYQPKPAINIADLSVDSILDKIHKYGIDSLLKEEKEFLDQSSKN